MQPLVLGLAALACRCRVVSRAAFRRTHLARIPLHLSLAMLAYSLFTIACCTRC